MISIIIPVYNSEQYLRACIDSVLAQTFTDFELLLINDGSTDFSGKMCDEYALKDARVKVFHKENGGVSSARNLGIQEAEGEWLCFIDSDDTVNDKYLSDFILGRQLYDHCDFVLQGFLKPINNITIQEANLFKLKEFIQLYGIYPLPPYCKLFNTNILKQKKILFLEDLSFGEDTLFVLDYLAECKLILCVAGNNYTYNKVQHSLSTKILNYEQNLLLVTELQQKLDKLSLNKKLIFFNLRYPLGKLLRSIFTDFENKHQRKEKLSFILSEFLHGYLYIFRSAGLKGKIFYILLKQGKISLIEFIYRKLYRYA